MELSKSTNNILANQLFILLKVININNLIKKINK